VRKAAQDKLTDLPEGSEMDLKYMFRPTMKHCWRFQDALA